jgi:type IV secretory pathway TrbF-like protein
MTETTKETNGHGTATEVERLEASYRIIAQRDGTAERRAFHWKLLACALVAITLGVGIWDHVDRRERLQAFVQVVQVTDNGQVVNVGQPQDLLTYEVKDAQWLDMLTEWVRKIRWKGSDLVATKANWNWAKAHLCGGPVQRLMDTHQAREKPFDTVGKKLTSIEITHATNTPVPQTYHVFWNEITSEATIQKEEKWTGTFTVARMQPETQAVLLHNRLGLCISAFSISPVHLGGEQ